MHRALEKIFYEVREPQMTWNDIGGLKAPKERLREMVCFVLEKGDGLERMGIAPPTGVVMWGPLGTGITMLAEAAASEAEATFVYVSGQEMLGKEKQMEEAFLIAKQEAPAILFISDLEWVCPRAGADYSWSKGNFRGIPPTFASSSLSEKFIGLVDSLEDFRDVRLLGSCYRIDTVDQALIKEKKRFNRKIYVPPFDEEDRKEVLEIYAGKMPLSAGVDLSRIARATEGYVGWDIENLCRKAAVCAISRGEDRVSMDDFSSAMKDIKPWLTPDMVDRYNDIYEKDCPHHYHF